MGERTALVRGVCECWRERQTEREKRREGEIERARKRERARETETARERERARERKGWGRACPPGCTCGDPDVQGAVLALAVRQ